MSATSSALRVGQRVAAAARMTSATATPAANTHRCLHSGKGGDGTSVSDHRSNAVAGVGQKRSKEASSPKATSMRGASATGGGAAGGRANRYLHYESASSPNTSTLRERSRTVGSFYNQTAIDTAAAKQSVRLTPATIMYSGAGTAKNQEFIMKSAQYLHRELPIRVAHRIHAIRSLPFIVGCNPTILSVHEQYIRSFHILNDFPAIETPEQEEEFAEILKALLDEHKNVVSNLAQGFKEARKHIKDEEVIRNFLDRNLTSRLGIRMLATHQITLRDKKPGMVGIINVKMTLKEVIERWCHFVQEIAESRYGTVPAIRISGHVTARFPYIEMPLDYILPELLKNAVRATVESHTGMKGPAMPPIQITVANNDTDFIIKISDRGGGIPHNKIAKVMQYSFSTAEESTEQLMDEDVFGNLMEACNRTTSGPMHGYGFGLPTSRAYAEYLGGSLTIHSMQGLGTDVYLRLSHFNASEPFRI